MARRATVLEGYRREPVPTLTLVGADEFSPDTELPDPAKTGDASPEAVRAVYAVSYTHLTLPTICSV